MKRFLVRLRSNLGIGISAVLVLAVMSGFQFMRPSVGGQYLDTIMSVFDLIEVLANMDAGERAVHAQVTAWLDTLFPIAYVLLGSALLLRFAGGTLRAAGLFLLFATAGLDLSENRMELILLDGGQVSLTIKTLITQAKFACLALAAACLLVSLAGRLRGGGSPR